MAAVPLQVLQAASHPQNPVDKMTLPVGHVAQVDWPDAQVAQLALHVTV